MCSVPEIFPDIETPFHDSLIGVVSPEIPTGVANVDVFLVPYSQNETAESQHGPTNNFPKNLQ